MHQSPTLMALFTAMLLLHSSLLFALNLSEAKSQGLVHETPSGYIKAMKLSAEVKEFVNFINAKRTQHYRRISKKTGAPLKAVERSAGAKLTRSNQTTPPKRTYSSTPRKIPSGIKSNPSYTTVDRGLVRDIQSHLDALGYAPGPADGVPGRHTVTAVKAFQREWDIQPDGILSSTLLKMLKIALEAKSKSHQPVNKDPRFAGSGSGFTVGRDYAVTNHHVVDNCSKLVVYMNGSPVAGSVVASSDADDLALIKLTEPVSDQASFRSSGRVRLGEDIWVAGYPLRTMLASGLNVVSGGISALAGLGNNAKLIQISAPVQLGNSGGPLLDSSGNVVGVIVSKLDAKKFSDARGDIPQNINFAIKGTVVKSFLDIHGIDYLTATSEAEMHGEEIADKARKFTVPVECYK